MIVMNNLKKKVVLFAMIKREIVFYSYCFAWEITKLFQNIVCVFYYKIWLFNKSSDQSFYFFFKFNFYSGSYHALRKSKKELKMTIVNWIIQSNGKGKNVYAISTRLNDAKSN